MAKKLDLSSYKKADTSKTQSKHNKYTTFLQNEMANAEPLVKEEIKRFNMAFTDENYAVIQEEANKLGINLYSFIGALINIVPDEDIDEYIDSLPIKRTKDNVARRKGNPAKRINLKFSEAQHKKISARAERYNQTITQYVNVVIEVYTKSF